VDRVVDTINAALQRAGQTSKAVERWYAEMPREEEMLPKDKYTIFDKKEKKYRKSIHSAFFYPHGTFCVKGMTDNCGYLELPKWTRVSQRVNPPGF
jgi:hypothetical protein